MLNSLKSGAGLGVHWRSINAHGEGVRRGNIGLRGQQHAPVSAGNGRMRRMFAAENMFPFRLYRLPRWYRTAPDPTDWLKFCVRAGRVLWWDATGTDGYDQDPYDEKFPVVAGAGVNEVSITADVPQFWFWLEIDAGAPSAIVKYGADPTANGWDAFPEIDSDHLPIGYVDTETRFAEKIPIVRQFLVADVIQIGSVCV